MKKVVRLLASAVAAAAAGVMSLSASAQTPAWPQRNVQFMLPFGAGSATDIAARLLAERLQTRWGKPVVIENRPGGDGLIAIRAFLQANDEHVLLYASSASFIAHPYTLPQKPPYELARDLAPIARVADTLLVVSVPVDMKVDSLKDWVAMVKASPGKFAYAGAPGLPELALNAFVKSEGLDVARVPYKDIVQAGSDLAESRIHILATSYAIAQPHVQSGRVKILAIGGRERSPILPTAPTAMETGYPILTVETTSALYGPASMPMDLRKRMANDVIEVLRDPVISKRLIETGQAPNGQGPEDLAKALVLQEAAAAAIAKELGITAR